MNLSKPNNPLPGLPAGYGSVRKRKQTARIYPDRYHLILREAVKRCGLRYWEEVEVWNPLGGGEKQRGYGAYQWLDFVVRLPAGGIGAIDFPSPTANNPKREARYINEKKALLIGRGIPYLVLAPPRTTAAAEVHIRRWLKQLERKR